MRGMFYHVSRGAKRAEKERELHQQQQSNSDHEHGSSLAGTGNERIGRSRQRLDQLVSDVTASARSSPVSRIRGGIDLEGSRQDLSGSKTAIGAQESPQVGHRDMDPGLWGRSIHSRGRSRSPQPPSTPGRRTPSNYMSRSPRNSYYSEDDYDPYYSDEEEAPWLNVPSCMTGAPLKDFDNAKRENESDNTFVVVQKKMGRQAVFRFSQESSFWLLSTTNPIRRGAVFIVTHQYFEMFILLTIVTNCVFMAISDSPEIVEYVFAVIYTFEMVVKIFAKGFILHKYSYLRNAWNWLDFTVVMLGYITMHPSIQNLSAIRTFRVLRALKTISTVKGLKAMVNTLIKSMKMMTDVIILTLFFMAIFALIGLQLFMGVLRSRCVKELNTTSVFNMTYAQELTPNGKLANIAYFEGNGEEIICGNNSFAWTCDEGYTCVGGVGTNPINNGYISYDNFADAFLTTMQVCTLDYWESVYNAILCAQGEPYMFYFLFAVFLGPFYLLNLVLAVVSASYEQEVNGPEEGEQEKLDQRELRRTNSMYSFDGTGDDDTMRNGQVVEFLHGESPITEVNGVWQYTVPDDWPVKKEKKPKEEFQPPVLGDNPTLGVRVQVFFYKFVTSSQFEGLIICCILLTTALMAAEHFPQEKILDQIIASSDYAFTLIFLIEMICKLLAYRLKGYVANQWNLFDGFLVIVSIIDFLLNITKIIDGNSLKFLRVFRLMRVLKLAQSWKTMGQLLSTIAQSLGALGNITVILGIIIYIFAVVGMQLFREVYSPENYDPLWMEISGKKPYPRYNFYNFGNSFMMVFRILCGKWIEPQWDLLRETSVASLVFIFLVFIIGRWVVLNLFLALLLSSCGGDALSGEDGSDSEDSGSAKSIEPPRKTRLQRMIEWTKRRKRRRNSDTTYLSNQEDLQALPPIEIKDSDAIDTITNEDPNNPEIMHVKVFNSQNSGVIIENGHDTKEVIVTNGHGITRQTSETNGTIIITKEDQVIKKRNSASPSTSPRLNNNNNIGEKNNIDIDYDPMMLGHTYDDGSSWNTSTGRVGGNDDQQVKIEIHREKTFVDDCLCSFCYKCSCCYTSYLESPIRRTWHNCRFYAKKFIEHKYFEGVILFLIGFSSMTLVFEDVYLDQKPTLKTFLQYCNYFFAIIFFVEFLLKLFALGFIKYFTNAWNLLDVFIVAISLASLFGKAELKALRSLRGLRPLRAVSRFQGMKVVVNSMIYSIPAIASVSSVCFVFWLIFSIMGYQLFGGQFHRCHDAEGNKVLRVHVKNKTECDNHAFTYIHPCTNFISNNHSWTGNLLCPCSECCRNNITNITALAGNIYDGINVGNKTTHCTTTLNSNYTWDKRNINFDSSIDGILALFQTATLEGWFEAMADASDAVGQDQQPGYIVSFAPQIFFVIFINLGAFFILNLFIGVIIDNFNKLKQQYEDGPGICLTADQRNWINTLKASALQKPSRMLTKPKEKWRLALFDFVHTKYFEFFIMSVILLNMVTMMIQHYGQSPEVTLALTYLNYLFTGIFTLEAVVRLIAMRLEYFRSGMNVFDFVIVIFSIAVILMKQYEIKPPIAPGLFRVVRVFRLGRMLRFFEAARGIRKLLFTIIKSAPALINIGTLLFLIMFIFSILFMSVFGHVKLTGSLNERINFKTFFSSLCLLFRIATAAGWNGVLDAAMIHGEDCDPTYKGIVGLTSGNCGATLVAPLLFTIYVVLIVILILNLYIAVILENFNQAQSQDEVGISEDDMEQYYVVWEKYDPRATQFIDYTRLTDFIEELEPPLTMPRAEMYKFLERNDIPIKEKNRCHCLDLLKALVEKALMESGECDEVERTPNFETVLETIEQNFQRAFPLRTKEVTKETTKERIGKEMYAVRRIQRVFRKHMLMTELKSLSAASMGAGQRLRMRADKNLEKIEHLVTSLWKSIKSRQDELARVLNRQNRGFEDDEQNDGLLQPPEN